MKNRIKSRAGFALVECVVAIGVFTIMALIVAMILSASVDTHRKNVEQNRSLKNQKDDFSTGGTNDRNGTADKRKLEIDFGGGLDVEYIFDAKVSVNYGGTGLELTEFFTNTTGFDRQGLEENRIMPISLSKVPAEAIMKNRTAGIAVQSPNSDALKNRSMTNQWGGYVCDGTHASLSACITAAATPCFKKDVPEIASKRLFAYRIPAAAVPSVPAHLAVWSGAVDYNTWSSDKANITARGTNPGGGKDLIANMFQLVVNREIPKCCTYYPSCSCGPCQIIMHIPDKVQGKDVVGIIVESSVKDLVWFETNLSASYVPPPKYPGTGLKYPGTPTSSSKRFDIIMERPPGKTRFEPFSIAIITEDHITLDAMGDPLKGDLRGWLKLQPCAHKGGFHAYCDPGAANFSVCKGKGCPSCCSCP
ncbi:MAG: hypothetical protein FWG33_00900 [Oscillospiraceae bacterium]|nr:hypothetical protein [Oscillospiraceae bacterium]